MLDTTERSIHAYLKELRRLRPSGDLVRDNLRFVVTIARNYQFQGLPLADLISEGTIGLMQAARRYDPAPGYKFLSYAVWYIRQAIQLALFEYGQTIRVPSGILEERLKLKKTAMRFEQREGRVPTDTELWELSGLTPQRFETIVKSVPGTLPLEQPDRETGLSLLDRLGIEPADEDTTIDLGYLTDRQKRILELSFGLNGEVPRDQWGIGQELGITGPAVCAAREVALKKCRKFIKLAGECH